MPIHDDIGQKNTDDNLDPYTAAPLYRPDCGMVVLQRRDQLRLAVDKPRRPVVWMKGR